MSIGGVVGHIWEQCWEESRDPLPSQEPAGLGSSPRTLEEEHTVDSFAEAGFESNFKLVQIRYVLPV